VNCSILNVDVLYKQRDDYRRGNEVLDVIVRKLLEDAEAAVSDGVFSVMDKIEVPPSGEKHDYLHPAPYYWPNPSTATGLPYVYRDGERNPDTILNSSESAKYDRTRLQKMFNNTFILALAHFFTGDPRFATHAVDLLRTWFLDPRTGMNPNLRYAQFIPGRKKQKGKRTGIIETKDLYFFLDGVRLLEESKDWTRDDTSRLQRWCGDYLDWLQTSHNGRLESWAFNNHGTYYDLQVAALARFIEDERSVQRTLRRAKRRLGLQFSRSGKQRFEVRRSITLHYCCFNLQGWSHLATVATRAGEDLWEHESLGGSLEQAFKWLFSHFDRDWPYRQIERFDHDRFYPLLAQAKRRYPDIAASITMDDIYGLKSRFDPHDGIRPYWQLGL